ncbi:coiled-coil domain-containing protein 102A [Cimex lectularius]|uniref:Coiled-coil domain-containing protein 102A n=1 Tax=Cimex lectularius TaxID=79782 RepID=A0A8I6RCH6_CIMLE|nr:coiled-coil domain-containing protein 102A [Cimex lectularius]XP_014243554.1 coiled-coil domain-containing protein 102A [Cimex lectularius]
MAHAGSTSRRHDGSITTTRGFVETDWEAKEALRQRELEEARARAAQMEKTMRWWSDCTANWREKWSKVRNERNRAREEAKLLRSKLDSAIKDTCMYKREKMELESHNEQMKKELERIHLLLLKHAGQWDNQLLLEALDTTESDREPFLPEREEDINSCSDIDRIPEKDSGVDDMSNLGASSKNGETDNKCSTMETVSTIMCGDIDSWTGDGDEITFCGSVKGQKKDDLENNDVEMMYQKLSMLQLRLDETTKTLQVEREEKCNLMRTVERSEEELLECKQRCEELRASRQEAVRELLQLQDQHQDTVALIRADLLDEATSREGMDRRLAELRAQLERLQAENAAEWGKRERLETEKLALERENKKLRADLRDVQERLERRGRPVTTTDNDLRHLQQEVSDKAKELTDIKHSHNKLKKVVTDKTTELAHTTRRAEQYEAEVKRLRTRVEELKRELAVAEDEVDSATNNLRKMQRTNDELQEQVESLQVQLQHLQTRMRNAVGNHRSPSIHQEEEQSDEDVY